MQLLLQAHGWGKLLTPELLVVAAGAALLYAKAGNLARTGPDEARPLPRSRQVAFYSGLLVFYLAYGGIFSLLAREAIDYYVLQMGLRYFLMVPLLITGLDRDLRIAMIQKLPLGKRWLKAWQHGPGAAIVCFALISLMLFSPVHNLLVELAWLRLLCQMLLLLAAWLMWEGVLLRPAHSKHQAQAALTLSVLGCVMLFPICVTLLLSDPGAYQHAHLLNAERCAPPDVHVQLLQYWTGSTSNFGGLLLMGIQQLAFCVVVLAKSGEKLRRKQSLI